MQFKMFSKLSVPAMVVVSLQALRTAAKAEGVLQTFAVVEPPSCTFSAAQLAKEVSINMYRNIIGHV